VESPRLRDVEGRAVDAGRPGGLGRLRIELDLHAVEASYDPVAGAAEHLLRKLVLRERVEHETVRAEVSGARLGVLDETRLEAAATEARVDAEPTVAMTAREEPEHSGDRSIIDRDPGFPVQLEAVPPVRRVGGIPAGMPAQLHLLCDQQVRDGVDVAALSAPERDSVGEHHTSSCSNTTAS
jgi:hypothetical protein